jgi:hypothetical protein
MGLSRPLSLFGLEPKSRTRQKFPQLVRLRRRQINVYNGVIVLLSHAYVPQAEAVES